jgi:hypothetical protein
MCAHTIMVGYDVALLHICGRFGPRLLAQVVGFRLGAVVVGMGIDVVRRYVFMQHRQAQQQASQKKQA